ncbi:hypothetical protein TELCIR_20608 [Teladorsagia circumcincta]|uniref:Uncharacterized protein n=1 Tax=Teladorsagia circumcincta TaxID=45464 RepID=A0A2G9TJ13_TELCI|nr:hypothetical protein TELCIR_20608 [Teladorsagia circumcincta]
MKTAETPVITTRTQEDSQRPPERKSRLSTKRKEDKIDKIIKMTKTAQSPTSLEENVSRPFRAKICGWNFRNKVTMKDAVGEPLPEFFQ